MVQNPFNGIERAPCMLPQPAPRARESVQWNWKGSLTDQQTGRATITNPFNGIESRFVGYDLVVWPRWIRSMELKEVLKVLSLEDIDGVLESVQWNWKWSFQLNSNKLEGSSWESVQWNWKAWGGYPHQKQARLGIRSMELKVISASPLHGSGRAWCWIRSMELKAFG